MVTVTIGNTLGALQIGTVVAVYLFGIVTVQVHSYFQSFDDDKRIFKMLSAAIFFLELVHTICICGETYRGSITYYGNPLGYQRYPFMGAATIFGGLITILVQSFFSVRVWKALPSPLNFVGAVCGVGAIVRGIGGVALGVRVIQSRSLAEYRVSNTWLIRALLAGGTGIDVIIAASMLYYLFTKRNSGLGPATRLIDRLVTFTVRTGFLTSLTAITVLVTFERVSGTFVWIAIYVILAKLYSNSLLSALNERKRLRDVIAKSSVDVDSRVLRQQHHLSSRTRQTFHPAISIEMKTTVTCDEEKDTVDSLPQKP